MRSFELDVSRLDYRAVNVEFPLSSLTHQVLEQTVFSGRKVPRVDLHAAIAVLIFHVGPHYTGQKGWNSCLQGPVTLIQALAFCGMNRGTTTVTICSC